MAESSAITAASCVSVSEIVMSITPCLRPVVQKVSNWLGAEVALVWMVSCVVMMVPMLRTTCGISRGVLMCGTKPGMPDGMLGRLISAHAGNPSW